MLSPSLEAEAIASGIAKVAPDILSKLLDVGAGRLAAMDAGRISVQVLSQPAAVGSEDPEGCRQANDYLRDVIAANPTRFAGFAVLPMAFPDQAAAELNRSVTELGLKGAMIFNHLKNGTYYDGEQFVPVFEMAQELDVPLYLHPAPPATDVAAKLYAGNYSASVAGRIGTGAWGWHVDVGLHVVRLYGAGLFTRFPRLKIIIGHNGEDLPMFIDRIESQGLRNDTAFNMQLLQEFGSSTSYVIHSGQYAKYADLEAAAWEHCSNGKNDHDYYVHFHAELETNCARQLIFERWNAGVYFAPNYLTEGVLKVVPHFKPALLPQTAMGRGPLRYKGDGLSDDSDEDYFDDEAWFTQISQPKPSSVVVGGNQRTQQRTKSTSAQHKEDTSQR
ncbi:hypothetical protein E8E13_002703 [Curvularia kusanoi]|uniref:Amidohydrolase-related domain-containing protein n=1 Tax=Curvularia kusanoi TaxID=90978 RepID=A0A9P4T805_CURKU|nr:hypothetical protein E8E13_002703 [Curvularia kusanoi]